MHWLTGSERNKKLTRGINPTAHRGLEVGALNNPIIPPEAGIVEFVDYTTTEGLKEQHKGLPDRVAGIVDVHHVWSGGGSLVEVVGRSDAYDFAIASHVIEHVPNTLGWFRGIMGVLKPGGVFNLAIPDKRYTFDINCPVSTVGQLLEADLYDYRVPSVRQMVDHCIGIAAIEPGHIWREPTDPEKLPPFNGDTALWLAEAQAREIVGLGRYFDSHCWIYTPESFLKLIRQAASMGRFGYEIEAFDNTEPGEFEFFISLKKPELDAGIAELKRKQLDAIDHHLLTLAEIRRQALLTAA